MGGWYPDAPTGALFSRAYKWRSWLMRRFVSNRNGTNGAWDDDALDVSAKLLIQASRASTPC